MVKTKKRNSIKRKVARNKKRSMLRLKEREKNVKAGKYKKKNELLELVQGKNGRFVRKSTAPKDKSKYIDNPEQELCLICKKPIGERHMLQVKKFCSDKCRKARVEFHEEYLKNKQTVASGKKLEVSNG